MLVFNICLLLPTLFFIFGVFSGCSNKEKMFLFNPYRDMDFATIGRYKAEFHAHTNNSDGLSNPNATVERFSELGFDFLALSDHDFMFFGRFPNNPPDHIGLRDWPNHRAFTITYPWERFGVADRRGITPIQASELSRLHHINMFFSDFVESRLARNEFELLAQAVEYDNGIRFQLNHPQRHIDERLRFGGGLLEATSENRMGWLDNQDPNALYTALWYQNLLNNFPEILAIEVFSQNDRYYDSRIHYDRIMRGMMPARPVWLSANSDNHGEHYGQSVNVMLLQENTLECFQAAFERGAFFAKSFGEFDPKMLEVDGSVGDRWNYMPTVKDIIIDDKTGYIKVAANTYTHFEWITEDGVIVATGNTINFKTNPYIRNYVRGVLTNSSKDGMLIATTLMQPFGVGVFNSNSWFFYFDNEESISRGDVCSVHATMNSFMGVILLGVGKETKIISYK